MVAQSNRSPRSLLDTLMPSYDSRAFEVTTVPKPRSAVFTQLKAGSADRIGWTLLGAEPYHEIVYGKDDGVTKIALGIRLEDVPGGTRIATESRGASVKRRVVRHGGGH